MPSQRKEHFRFTFNNPLDATFCIVKIGDELHWKNVKSSIGSAKVLDISPGGLRIETGFNFPVNKLIILQLTLGINDEELVLTGRVKWQEKRSGNFHYGIRLQAVPEEKQKIINELKKYSKKMHGLNS